MPSPQVRPGDMEGRRTQQPGPSQPGDVLFTLVTGRMDVDSAPER